MKLGEKNARGEKAQVGEIKWFTSPARVTALTAEPVTAQLPPLITCHHWVL